MMPQRIQRSRAKGWRMPEGAVFVGRPTKWGNPYKVGPRKCGCRTEQRMCKHDEFRVDTAREARDAYRLWLLVFPAGRALVAEIESLRGRDLVCWCKPGEPCHADVLIEIANQEPKQ